MGEGGFIAPPPDYFLVLQDICRRHGILLIADEVQTGMGRTGHMFASEHYGLEPDLLLAAKSLGGGLPLASVTGRAEIMDAPVPGGLGGTFAANPLSCEAALAALDILEEGSLYARAIQLGERFKQRAVAWQKDFSIIGDIRGLGAMQAIELVRTPSGREPADEETKKIARYCYEHGLLLMTAGSYNNVVRILMPLVVTDEQFEEGLEVIGQALHSVSPALAGQHSA